VKSFQAGALRMYPLKMLPRLIPLKIKLTDVQIFGECRQERPLGAIILVTGKQAIEILQCQHYS